MHPFLISLLEKGLSDKPLQYDYTYLDARDSVSMLMTVVTRKPVRIDSLLIQLPSTANIKHPLEQIYIQPKGKKWENRLQCTISYQEWCLMYASPEPFILQFSMPDEDNEIVFADKRHKWTKIAARFTGLQQIIELNKTGKDI